MSVCVRVRNRGEGSKKRKFDTYKSPVTAIFSFSTVTLPVPYLESRVTLVGGSKSSGARYGRVQNCEASSATVSACMRVT